jgi:hypothetical protein
MKAMSEPIKLSWWARIFRSRAYLTYWLDGEKYEADVTDFKEVKPDCIVFKNFYTMKKTMVRYNCTIIYKLEEIK